MSIFINNGIKIEYEADVEGVPLVFLHGMGGSMKQIYSTYDPIPGVRLITLNQEGHGNTDARWDRFDFNALTDDVIALLNFLHVDKAFFAGISMGAAVCLNLVTRHPERVKGLILIRNAWTDQPMQPKVVCAYHDMGLALRDRSIDEFFQSDGWKIVKEEHSAYTENAFTCTFKDKSCLDFWQKYLILPPKAAVLNRECIKRINVPTEIVACHHDLCHPFEYGEYLQKVIPNANLIEIPNKDEDGKRHRELINSIIYKTLSLELQKN